MKNNCHAHRQRMNSISELFKTEAGLKLCAHVRKEGRAPLLTQANGNGPKWLQCKGSVEIYVHLSLLLNQGLDIVSGARLALGRRNTAMIINLFSWVRIKHYLQLQA